MECIVKVNQLQIELSNVKNVIETIDGRVVSTLEPSEDDPVKLEQIRLKKGDKIDIPVSVFKMLGTSVMRYIPEVASLSELEALEALDTSKTAKTK